MAENDKQGDSFVSQDKFDNPHEKALLNTPTVTDANGIERIVGSPTTEWTPAPLEASDEEKAAAERRNKMFDEASKTRAALLKGEVKDEDRALNDPSQGGSQSGTLTEAEKDNLNPQKGDGKQTSTTTTTTTPATTTTKAGDDK